jgi:hypothetical protein
MISVFKKRDFLIDLDRTSPSVIVRKELKRDYSSCEHKNLDN